ncbi:uncharacterized protein LOC141613665 [Silene latifolia]|uniref:uncharacterized protein LOC141613665 n=1 Tax=Silene latifolia TaxID=37657 RepID=UPI003D77F47D
MAVMKFTTNNRFTPLKSITNSYQNPKNDLLSSKRSSSSQQKTKGTNFEGPGLADAQKIASLRELNGIPVLDMSDATAEVTGAGWILHKNGKDVPVLETIDEEEDVTCLLQFTSADIKKEVDFWNNAVFCYILGANPPWELVESFIYRVWDKFGIDRVSFLDNGAFLVRFTTVGARDALLKSVYYLFDNNLWLSNHGFWIWNWLRLKWKLYLCLVGKFVQEDKDTHDKVRLSFARVLVELQMDQELPDKVKFLDETGKVVSVGVDYEWMPRSCTSCNGIGHNATQCRKPGRPSAKKAQKVKGVQQQKQVWRPVQKPPVQSTVSPPPFTSAAFPPLSSVRATPSVRPTPAKQIMKNTRQEGIVGIRLSDKFSKYTFVDVLVANTPTGIVGDSGKDPPQTKVVKWFLHNHGVGLFGLIETKIKPNNLLKKNTSLCDGWSITTNCSWHKGGRIWVFWKPNLFDLQFLSYGAQHIHMYVHSRVDNKKFYLTMIYAFNDLNERIALWNFLKLQSQTCVSPWLWMGDFNAVLSPIERLGGSTTEAEMKHFQECVSLCGMEDINATGALYTWSNKQEPNARVYSRLDRAMGNQEWLDDFGDYMAHFHPEGLFDHCPCTVKYKGTKMFSMVKKLKALKPVLKKLNTTCFSDIENSTTIASRALEEIQEKLVDNPRDFDLIQQELDLSGDLKGLITARDSFLTQKAKLQWSLEGDLNTSYFHRAIKKRIMLNKVFQIEDMQGVLCTEGGSIQDAFLTYYQKLLVTSAEVKACLFSIPSCKSPGPDGYNSQFYKDAWDVVGDEICASIINFFDSGQLLSQINATVITLIPKIDRPTSVVHYRPISCCNVLYKVISKILCARLALVLHDIISKNQGAFVKGRSILENILICQDLVRMYNRKAASPRCMFKLDLQKAYDSIEWGDTCRSI